MLINYYNWYYNDRVRGEKDFVFSLGLILGVGKEEYDLLVFLYISDVEV